MNACLSRASTRCSATLAARSLNIYDALYGYEGKIRHILTAPVGRALRHAADGYARSTGKVGVCFATSGPAATNLTTGIATAYYDFLSRRLPHRQRA